MFSQKMQEMLAVDLALLIVALLFYILLLLFREYQKVSQALNRFSLSHQSIEDKLSLLNEVNIEPKNNLFDQRKLDKLIALNMNIEKMFNVDLSDKNKQLHFHQKEIMQLTKNIKASTAFIKKLKMMTKDNGDALLEETQENLAKQSAQLNKLRIESDKINLENEQLKRQLKKHLIEIKVMRERGELYTQKLIEQGKELERLKAKAQMQKNGENNKELNQQIEQLNSQLNESSEELQRISTEKEFLEIQFLDILEEFEKDHKTTEAPAKSKKSILI